MTRIVSTYPFRLRPYVASNPIFVPRPQEYLDWLYNLPNRALRWKTNQLTLILSKRDTKRVCTYFFKSSPPVPSHNSFNSFNNLIYNPCLLRFPVLTDNSYLVSFLKSFKDRQSREAKFWRRKMVQSTIFPFFFTVTENGSRQHQITSRETSV